MGDFTIDIQWTWKESEKRGSCLAERIRIWLIWHLSWLVVWNIFYFPIYWEFHHPNWLSYLSEGFKPPTSKNSGIWYDLFIYMWRCSKMGHSPSHHPSRPWPSIETNGDLGIPPWLSEAPQKRVPYTPRINRWMGTRNLAPVDRWFIPFFTGFQSSGWWFIRFRWMMERWPPGFHMVDGSFHDFTMILPGLFTIWFRLPIQQHPPVMNLKSSRWCDWSIISWSMLCSWMSSSSPHGRIRLRSLALFMNVKKPGCTSCGFWIWGSKEW